MKRIITNLFIFFFYITTNAQYGTIPLDSAVRYGKLPNGLTYYIRHNELPKNCGEFYIVQNVGAILEEDSQNGLAHFLEHMAFNGTKNFPDKGIIRYMESIGAKFGANVNAYTSLDETVYMLRNIPLPRKSVVDSALLILHDWSNFISLDETEIDRERGVICEEWRTGATANRRMWKLGNQKKYIGSPYAKRDIIGDTAVIKHFHPDTLRAYYKKWYRPDLQAIIVVGDINIDDTEKAIKIIFSDIPTPQNVAQRIWHSLPNNDETIISIVRDPEARASYFNLEFKKNAADSIQKQTTNNYLQTLTENILCHILQERFQKITNQPNSSIIGGFADCLDFNRKTTIFNIGVIAKKGNEKEAFDLLLQETERLKRFGITESEFDLAKTEFLANYKKIYEERNTVKNCDYVKEYSRSFTQNEPIPGIEWEYKFIQKALSQKINTSVINKLCATIVHYNNLIVDVAMPEKQGIISLTEKDIQESINKIQSLYIKPYENKRVNQQLLSKIPKEGFITKESKNEKLNYTEWFLSNGAHVVLKPTNFKDNEILLHAYSDGGISLVNDIKDLYSATVADELVSKCGVGNFSIDDLQQILNGKQFRLHTFIGNDQEGFDGSSTKEDLESMFQLLYMKFTSPRKDKKAYQVYVNGLKTSVANIEADPNYTFSDSVSLILGQHHPRLLSFNKKFVDNIHLNTAYKIYKNRFCNIGDFTFMLVGDFSIDSIKPFVLRYIGGVKGNPQKEEWKDNYIRYPKGKSSTLFEKGMTVQKTSVLIHLWSDMIYNRENSIQLSALSDILRLRYTESLREEEGGTYGATVSSTLTYIPQEQATLSIRFDTNAEMYKKLIKIALNELDSIAKYGPKIEDIERVKQNKLKVYKDQIKENGYWISIIKGITRDGIDKFSNYEKYVEQITPNSIQQIANAIRINGNENIIIMTSTQNDLKQ